MKMFNMVLFLILVQVVCLPMAVSFQICVHLCKTKVLQSDLSLNVIGSMGSDELFRPDDENSPEFKIYLKKLFEMQSTRARSGFVSPSSGSADAYIAKLNRIKLEKMARRAAGLPDDEVDLSYKPEDYRNAM